MGQLSEALVLDRTTLTRNLKPLRAKAYIKLVPGKDGRTKLVLITKIGSNALADALPEWKKAQQSLLKLYGTEDWSALRRNLDQLQSIARASIEP